MGLEPATFRLQIGCSTIELRRQFLAPGDLPVTGAPGRHSKSGPISRARTAEFNSSMPGRSSVFRRASSLSQGFVARRRRRGRHVQGTERTPHRKACQKVTSFSYQPPHPGPLGSENQSQVSRQVEPVEIGPRGVQPYNPKSLILNEIYESPEVLDPDDRDPFDGARG
jgi:hypothetical protein